MASVVLRSRSQRRRAPLHCGALRSRWRPRRRLRQLLRLGRRHPGRRAANRYRLAHAQRASGDLGALGRRRRRQVGLRLDRQRGALAAYGDSEAILRLPGTGALTPADFFAPGDWAALDGGDDDISGSGVILVDVPGASPSALAIALGKDGKAYLRSRSALGGIGPQPADGQVANPAIIGAPAAFSVSSGTYVVFKGSGRNGTNCPRDLAAIRLTATSPPVAQGVWCGNQEGGGSPIVTLRAPGSDPLVRVVGSENSNRLRAFDGETGEVVFGGGGGPEQMGRVRRFATPIVSRGRLYVAGDNKVYAFTTK